MPESFDYKYFKGYVQNDFMYLDELIPLETAVDKIECTHQYMKALIDMQRLKLGGWICEVKSDNHSAIDLMIHLGAMPFDQNTKGEVVFIRIIDNYKKLLYEYRRRFGNENS